MTAAGDAPLPVAKLTLPDGMRWSFTVDGINMNPSIWPTTDGGTAIELKWDPRDTALQTALEEATRDLSDFVSSRRVVQAAPPATGSDRATGALHAIRDADEQLTAAQLDIAETVDDPTAADRITGTVGAARQDLATARRILLDAAP
ncbi:MAG: hypothetical protein F4Y94_10380 [Chloroflexi bacterium]|nr:hypothetical protein [Chloroflexota bacterium]